MRISLDPNIYAEIEKLDEFKALIPRARKSALSKAGYFLRERLMAYPVSGSNVPPVNPHTSKISIIKKRLSGGKGYSVRYQGRGKNRRRMGRYIKLGGGKSAPGGRTTPFGRLINAVRYKTQADGSVVLGLYEQGQGSLSPRLSRIIQALAGMSETIVTPRMRKFFFGIGFPLSGRTMSLHRPARPWFGPVFERYRRDVEQLYERAMSANLTRYQQGGSK